MEQTTPSASVSPRSTPPSPPSPAPPQHSHAGFYQALSDAFSYRPTTYLITGAFSLVATLSFLATKQRSNFALLNKSVDMLRMEMSKDISMLRMEMSKDISMLRMEMVNWKDTLPRILAEEMRKEYEYRDSVRKAAHLNK